MMESIVNANSIFASSGSDKVYDNGSDNGITNDPAVIANAYNYYFVHIGPILSSKIPEKGKQYRKYMPKGMNIHYFFSQPRTRKWKILLNS